MPSNCYAYNCPSKRRRPPSDQPRLQFYCFPKHHGRRMLWTRNCGRLEEPRESSSNAVLCQLHFEHRYFENERKEPEGRWKLKPNAIPTLFYERAPAMPEETVHVQAYYHNGRYFQSKEATVKVTKFPLEHKNTAKLRSLLQAGGSKQILIDDSETQNLGTLTDPPIRPPPSQTSADLLKNKMYCAIAPKPNVDTQAEQVNVCYFNVDRIDPDTPVIIELLNRAQVKSLPGNLKIKIWNDKEPKLVLRSILPTPVHNDHLYVEKAAISQRVAIGTRPPQPKFLFASKKRVLTTVGDSMTSTEPAGADDNDDYDDKDDNDSTSAPTVGEPIVRLHRTIGGLGSSASVQLLTARPVVNADQNSVELQKELDEARIALQNCRYELRNERAHVRNVDKKMERMTRSLSFLGADQQEAMTRRTEGMKWSAETLQKAFILYFGLGNRAYEMINRTLRIPMPAIRSLQRYIKINNPHSEFFNYVFDTIKKHKIKGHVVRDEPEQSVTATQEEHTVPIGAQEVVYETIAPATEEQVAINNIAAISGPNTVSLQSMDISTGTGNNTAVTGSNNIAMVTEVNNITTVTESNNITTVTDPNTTSMVQTEPKFIPKHQRKYGIGTPLKRKLVSTPVGSMIKHLRTTKHPKTQKREQKKVNDVQEKKPRVKKAKAEKPINAATPGKGNKTTEMASLVQEPEVEIHYDWSNAIITESPHSGITYVQYPV